MAFYLEKAIFINRAPFDRLELDFKKNGINVLSAVNGKGKTTILTHIVDAIYEMARPHYGGSFAGNENKLYRVSSPLFNLDLSKPSLVFFRFRANDESIDYIDCVGKNLTEDQYDEIGIALNIPYKDISGNLKNDNSIKLFSGSSNKEKVRQIFENNVLTFFPVYRYENPYYLNDPYKISLEFNIAPSISGYLRNPIEVVTEVKMLANWIMDVVLDKEVYKRSKSVDIGGTAITIDDTPENKLYINLSKILQGALSSKYENGNVRFGIGKRNALGQRVSILHNKKNEKPEQIAPSIFCLSSGELSILCLFGEILRQADNLRANVKLDDINGIVLIDEVDLHLHIKLQKEILPKLFNLFPNVQFIVSSHSPFLNIGLADVASERTQIIDLDNNGIKCSPTNNELYKEVYDMMIEENSRFAGEYNNLLSRIKKGSKPIVITEGKTDWRHIKNAIKVLNRFDVDVDFYDVPDDFGFSKLETMLENLSKIKQRGIVIGVFDRDEEDTIKRLDAENQTYKDYGNNVYAFAIPLVNEDIYGKSISIEHYYNKENLLKEESENHRRLFYGGEFHTNGNSKDGQYQTRISKIQNKVEINGVIDEKVYRRDDLEQKNSVALTKNAFVTLIETDKNFAADFNFENFNKIIDIINSIVERGLV